MVRTRQALVERAGVGAGRGRELDGLAIIMDRGDGRDHHDQPVGVATQDRQSRRPDERSLVGTYDLEGSKKYFRKAFPAHWSYLVGEVALFSLVVLLFTGTFTAADGTVEAVQVVVAAPGEIHGNGNIVGIVQNTRFLPEGGGGWYFEASALEVPAIWDAARAAGLTGVA